MTDLPSTITIRDKYGPAMEITDPTQASEYFKACVRHCMSFGKTQEEATQIELVNLLYGASHPIFGDHRPTAAEAFEAGREAGRRMFADLE